MWYIILVHVILTTDMMWMPHRQMPCHMDSDKDAIRYA